jgi:hypothetical protein
MGKEIVKEREEEKKDRNGSEEIQRITVSKEAQGALGGVVDRVNNGFVGGKVNRTQMANWILLRFSNELDDSQVKEIRAEHFDEVAMLEAILKRAKESGKVPTDFKALLQKQLGLDESTKKKVPRALTGKDINDVMVNTDKKLGE